jgi:hypothetical protein
LTIYIIRFYWKTYSKIKEVFPYRRGIYYVSNDFHIINGAEVNLKDEGHLLLLGDMSEIRSIDEKLRLSDGYRPSLEELLTNVSSEIIVIGAHPFRPFSGLMQFAPSQLKLLHALELNGSDPENADHVQQFTKIIGMPIVGGSDAHVWPMIGVSHTILPDCNISVANLKQSIVRGMTNAEIDEDANTKTDMSNRFKGHIKNLLCEPSFVIIRQNKELAINV